MSASSTIEWTDATWNPVTGCDHVSLGCDNCYAERMATRFGRPFLGAVELHPERLSMPSKWRKPRRVFVNSVSDLFHPDVPDEFIARVFAEMGAAERHTFQVLTKRPQRMERLLGSPEFVRDVQRHWWTRWFMLLDMPDRTPARRADDAPRPLLVDNRRKRAIVWASDRRSMPLGSSDLPYPLPNVWLGTSVENQGYADLRIPHLLTTPAAVRFLSVEPLLGPIDLYDSAVAPLQRIVDNDGPDEGRIDWVIVGGESGPGARPIDAEWVRTLRDQCVAASVPFFFKQWGGRTPKSNGRELDGRLWDEYPEAAA